MLQLSKNKQKSHTSPTIAAGHRQKIRLRHQTLRNQLTLPTTPSDNNCWCVSHYQLLRYHRTPHPPTSTCSVHQSWGSQWMETSVLTNFTTPPCPRRTPPPPPTYLTHPLLCNSIKTSVSFEAKQPISREIARITYTCMKYFEKVFV